MSATTSRKRSWPKHLALAALLLALVTWLGFPALISKLGGAWTHPPSDLGRLSPEAQALLARAFEGIDAERLIDFHVHVAGIGGGGTGCFVNPKMLSWRHPVDHLRFRIYMNSAGIESIEGDTAPDARYLERLDDLMSHQPVNGRAFLLGFDKHYEPDGSPNLEATEFYVPNEYVWKLAQEQPEKYLPCISVHPYRADALQELERWALQGARLVKWLPNAMGIDPSDERCEAYYELMAEYDMLLLTHAGEEKAVQAEEDQRLGNPLLLRKALDMGVKVIVAHCASLGENEDLDDPQRPRISNFELFLRLMDDERYEGLVFGEISAVTQVNRLGEPLEVLLERTDLHPRLVNGSDYPLPAVNCVFHTGAIQRAGYITAEERSLLNEIYDTNPLLYDFALKRSLRSPTTGRGFPAELFLTRPELGL